MDYEKKYNEALNKAKEKKDKSRNLELLNFVDELFPELEESDDERIRKSIIGFLITISSLKDGKTVSNKDFDTKAILEWIAWLEKQGKQSQGKSVLKVVKEEKVDNTNKVEPRFKDGDIVQYITDSTDRRKIEEVDTLCNMYRTDSSPIMFENEDEWKVAERRSSSH